MPTVTLNKTVFEKLVGKKLPLEELKDRISMLGTDLESIEGNEINVEIFPNRPDLLSEQGFARAFSSFIGVKTGLRKYEVKKFGSKVVVKDLPKQWPYAVACVIKGLKIDDEKIKEIIQLQEKLGLTFTRNRKKGGIGLYPLDKITFPISFIGRKPDEINFRPLEFPRPISGLKILSQHPKGRDYGHIMESWETFPVFIDAKGIIMSMPPIINSHNVGKIDETTTDVFIEGTGPDLETIKKSLFILATSLADMGGQIYSLEMEYAGGKKFEYPDLTPDRMKLDLAYINKWLGLELKEQEAVALLARMSHGYDKKNREVLIPAYRTDIIHPVDLAEDIAIAYGYENFEHIIPNVSTIAEEDKYGKFTRKVRELLVGMGLLEAKNYHLISLAEMNNHMNLKETVVPLKDAGGEFNHLRNSILPSLLKNLRENKHHEYPHNIFELGRTFFYADTETGIGEKRHLSVILCHEKTDFTEIRQVMDALICGLDLQIEVKDYEHPSFIEGRVGQVFAGEKKIGIIGEFHPSVLENWELNVPTVGFELDLERIFATIFSIKVKEVKEVAAPMKMPKKTSEEFETTDTERLFYQDPYMKKAEAKVEKINGNEVILDKTIFFAFSGGQASDSGTINGINVVDVKKENHQIIHTLEKEPDFKAGDKVVLKLNWERRHKIMRLHSAGHIVYIPFVEKLGKPKIIGSNVSEDKTRIDFLYDKPINEHIPVIEKEANEIISKSVEISCKPDEKNSEKRWWSCEKLKMPCGGTHVKNTSEIGRIKLKRKNIGKGKERVEIYLE